MEYTYNCTGDTGDYDLISYRADGLIAVNFVQGQSSFVYENPSF